LAKESPHCDTLDKAIVVCVVCIEEVQVNWSASFDAEAIAGRSEVS